MAAPNEMESARSLISITTQTIRGGLDTSSPLQDYINGTSIATAKNWGSRFWDVIDKSQLKAGYYEPDGSIKDYNDLNNNQQGAIVLDGFRSVNANVNRASQVPSQVEATRQSAKDTADTETETDFGAPEAVERGAGGSSRAIGGGGGRAQP